MFVIVVNIKYIVDITNSLLVVICAPEIIHAMCVVMYELRCKKKKTQTNYNVGQCPT